MQTNQPGTGTGDGRHVLIGRLYAMAAWLEANPVLPLNPYIAINIEQFASTEEEASDIRRAAGGDWRKSAAPDSSWVSYEHGDEDSRWRLTYRLNVSKEAAGEQRVQVGSRHVEEHDEPVYEWRCGPDA